MKKYNLIPKQYPLTKIKSLRFELVKELYKLEKLEFLKMNNKK
jgi:hypothetical protein